MVPTFYILGLPRSRTLWFSEFFCTGVIECVHEHFSSHKKVQLIPGVRGYSDTNPLTTPDYGESPVLIIERDVEEVISSCLEAFDCPDGVEDWPGTVRNYIEMYQNALADVTPQNVLMVNYADIDASLYEIWKFLLPKIPVDEQRIEFFRTKVVKTENRNIEESLSRTWGTIGNFIEKFDPEAIRTFRITDYAIVKKIMTECWYEISEDDAPDYLPDIINEYWIGLIAQNEIIGCYRLHSHNSILWEGHVFMLKQHRKKYSVRGLPVMFRWMLTHTKFQKLIASVPEKFGNVIAFLENGGFIREGVNRKAFIKDGEKWDLINFGLTRAEIEGLV